MANRGEESPAVRRVGRFPGRRYSVSWFGQRNALIGPHGQLRETHLDSATFYEIDVTLERPFDMGLRAPPARHYVNEHRP
jgi:hypothetical protein